MHGDLYIKKPKVVLIRRITYRHYVLNAQVIKTYKDKDYLGTQTEQLKNIQKDRLTMTPKNSILVICAPIKDDGDYDFITEGAVHNAILPINKWLEDNDISGEMRMNYGSVLN